uniref:Uncharacterized protein n=1 Tax=Strongyloides papillosus TaxID=174720 RepID=A0A0N5CC16_STREA
MTDEEKKREREDELKKTFKQNCSITGTNILGSGSNSDLNLTYLETNVTDTKNNGTCVELYTQFLTNNTGKCEKYRCDKVDC